MLLEFFENTGQQATYGLNSNHAEPVVKLCSSELGGSGQGHLTNLTQVVVEGPDGCVARVWVSARLNARGQVQFELATNKSQGTTRARVTASWRL